MLLAGCGGSDDPGVGDEPITPAAIAAVAQEHVDLEPSRTSEWGVFTRELGDESPGAGLEYADVSLAVVVAPTSESPLVCAVPTFFDECVNESVDGHDVTIAWQDLEPEEDPGVVYVIERREGEDVAVRVTGASITDDPRDLDLGVPLADLVALVTDSRLSLRRRSWSSTWAPTWRSRSLEGMRPGWRRRSWKGMRRTLIDMSGCATRGISARLPSGLRGVCWTSTVDGPDLEPTSLPQDRVGCCCGERSVEVWSVQDVDTSNHLARGRESTKGPSVTVSARTALAMVRGVKAHAAVIVACEAKSTAWSSQMAISSEVAAALSGSWAESSL